MNDHMSMEMASEPSVYDTTMRDDDANYADVQLRAGARTRYHTELEVNLRGTHGIAARFAVVSNGNGRKSARAGLAYQAFAQRETRVRSSI
jgi:hypothetical protein